jgi:uncharacterized metal-binding protein YceD (DUF177 family)
MSKSPVIVPEFSRPLLVDRVPRKGSHEHITADEKECVALAKRFDVPQLFSFKARLLAMPWRGGGIHITGTVEADMERISVVSLEAFRRTEKFEVDRIFLPAKIIVDAVEDDAEPIQNGEVDLGETAAEAMGLELDPYPKKMGETYS